MEETGGTGKFDVALNHGEVGHFKRCGCCGAPLPQPYGEALEGGFKESGMPSRDRVFEINVCAGLGVGGDNYPQGCGRQLGK